MGRGMCLDGLGDSVEWNLQMGGTQLVRAEAAPEGGKRTLG